MSKKAMMSKSGVSVSKMFKSGVSKMSQTMTGISKMSKAVTGVSKMSKAVTSVSKTMTSVSKMSKTMMGVSDMMDSASGGEGDFTFGFVGDGGVGGDKSGNCMDGSTESSVAASVGNVSSDGYRHGGFMMVESMDITLLPLFNSFGGGGNNVVSEESLMSQAVSVSKTVMGESNVAEPVPESVTISKMSKAMIGVSVVGVHSNGVHGVDSVGEVGTMGGCHGGEGQAQEN